MHRSNLKNHHVVRPDTGRPRRWFALPMLLLALAVVSADWWHSRVHTDAGQAGHECSVLHWKAGELGFAGGALVPPAPNYSPVPETAPLRRLSPDSASSFAASARAPPLV